MQDKSSLFKTAIASKLGLETSESVSDASLLIRTGIVDAAFAFEEVHYSWIIRFLNTKTPLERRLYCSVLPAKLAARIARVYGLASIELILSPQARRYIFEQLYFALFPHAKISPLEWTQEPLSRLVYLGKVALERLCDFLGLYDLAAEMQLTIDKGEIEKIQSLLSQKEVTFLKRALGERPGWSLPKLGLSTWVGKDPGLRHVLQKRGIMRLCVALSGAHPWLIEHIKYKLDTGRAHILDTLVRSDPIEGATPVVLSQLEAIFESLNTNVSEASP
jgi:hypothetical protein